MIYTIGETVLDIIFKNRVAQTSKAGGSALNTSVSLVNLGSEVSFVTEIGNDEAGAFIIDFLKKYNVDISKTIIYPNRKTSLALAYLNEKNDAKYEFFKDLPDSVEPRNIDFEENDILLYSSSYALQKRTRKFFLSLIKNAQEKNVIRMYDPNMRKKLDKGSDEFKYLFENVGYAHIIRASDEDCQNIFGTTDSDKVYAELQKIGVTIFIYTQSSKYVKLYTPNLTKQYEVKKIKPISTIGAGDTFNAGVIHCIRNAGVVVENLSVLPTEFWDKTIQFAISCSAEVCESYNNYVLR